MIEDRIYIHHIYIFEGIGKVGKIISKSKS